MAEAQTNKERLKEITDSIETGIRELFQSDKYKQYLTTMSRFHRYSVNNQMLIYLQKPDATLCASFTSWKNKFERSVMKGEKGIKIIAPTPYKKMIEQEKLDPDTKKPILDADGKVITEEKVIQIPMYKVVTTFDYSQTDGKPLPELAENLTGNVQNYDVFMEALRRSAPVPIAFEAMSANMDGYFSTTDQRIAIREGMSEVQTVSAAIHEMAHSKLHNKELPEVTEQWKVVIVSEGGTKQDLNSGFNTEAEAIAEAEAHNWKYVDENQFEWRLEIDEDTSIAEFVKKSRSAEELEAESVSFSVCAYYGIQTGENSFGYLASYSRDKELSELRASLETINKTSSGLITDIDRNYAAIMKERGLDKAVPEQISPTVEYLMHSNPTATGDADRCFVQAYTKQDGELIPGDIIGVSTAEQCREISAALNEGSLTVPDAKAAFALDVPSIGTETPTAPVSEITVEETLVTTAPDNGAVPDPAISIESMNAYGYTDVDMLPLTKDRALELAERDVTVYLLHPDNTEAMAFDTDEVQSFDGIFGITREDWDAVKDELGVSEPQRDIEAEFLSGPNDSFAIYQLRDAPELTELRFMNSDYLQRKGLEIQRENYTSVYASNLGTAGDEQDKLNQIYATFNNDRPADFTGHSLSVSDIVALKQAGGVSCHYVDSWGFKELPTFLPQQNYLKNAEMAMEDDYNQIDGIVNNGKKETVAELEEKVKAGQPISLLGYVEAVRREAEPQKQPERSEKKPSVIAMLHSNVSEKPLKTAPAKSAEREI